MTLTKDHDKCKKMEARLTDSVIRIQMSRYSAGQTAHPISIKPNADALSSPLEEC